jgi:hypothetical protein
MPSLDGYSLNHKMDSLHEDVQAQIDQLKIDFHNLYEKLNSMKDTPKPKAKAKKKKGVASGD